MEVVVLPEMEAAGEQQLRECREQGLSDLDTVIAVYSAMRAVYAMALLQNGESIH